jgi:hypothetical protein
MRHVQPRASVGPANEQVRMEIHNFLQALASYPKSFAKNPEISFEEYLCTLIAVRKPERRRPN